MKKMLFLILSISLLIPPQPLFAQRAESIIVQTQDDSIRFSLPGQNDVSGISLAIADMGTDGESELIFGNGMGTEPRVHVLRRDGSEIGSFLAYDPTLGVGINVTACDLTGDGFNEIIVAPQRGGGPHIRIFNHLGEAIDAGGFFAYDATMREGVNLACGDLTGDARAELVTLPAPGGGPHIRLWSMDKKMKLVEEFFAYDGDDRSGVIGVVDAKKLFLSQQHTSSPLLKTIVIHTFVETLEEKNFGIDGLGVGSLSVFKDDLYLSTTSSPTLYNITKNSSTTLSVSHATLASDGKNLLIAPGRLFFSDALDTQRIEVDTTQQRLFAFENGILRNSFLISSGLNNATPLGNHSVLAKIPLVHYAWNYGAGNPKNYDLGWIPHNLRFAPHIYIHYAPWHNNFGYPMSHGCVNVGLANIQWLYDWAQTGIPVLVK